MSRCCADVAQRVAVPGRPAVTQPSSGPAANAGCSLARRAPVRTGRPPLSSGPGRDTSPLGSGAGDRRTCRLSRLRSQPTGRSRESVAESGQIAPRIRFPKVRSFDSAADWRQSLSARSGARETCTSLRRPAATDKHGTRPAMLRLRSHLFPRGQPDSVWWCRLFRSAATWGISCELQRWFADKPEFAPFRLRRAKRHRIRGAPEHGMSLGSRARAPRRGHCRDPVGSASLPTPNERDVGRMRRALKQCCAPHHVTLLNRRSQDDSPHHRTDVQLLSI